jgi:hypothetical protein
MAQWLEPNLRTVASKPGLSRRGQPSHMRSEPCWRRSRAYQAVAASDGRSVSAVVYHTKLAGD